MSNKAYDWLDCDIDCTDANKIANYTVINADKRRKAAEIRRRIVLEKAEERMRKLMGYKESTEITECDPEEKSDHSESEKRSVLENAQDQRCSVHEHSHTLLAEESEPRANDLQNFNNSCVGTNPVPDVSPTHYGSGPAPSAQTNRSPRTTEKTGTSVEDRIIANRFHVVACLLTAVLVRLVLATQMGESLFGTQSVLPVFVGMELILLFIHRPHVQVGTGHNTIGYLQTFLALVGIYSNVFNLYSSSMNYIVMIFEDFALFFVGFVLTHCIIVVFT